MSSAARLLYGGKGIMCTINRVAPELRIFLVSPANPGIQTNLVLQLKFCDIALINSKYIKTHWTLLRTVMHREAITVKVCFYPRISWENPTFAHLDSNYSYIQQFMFKTSLKIYSYVKRYKNVQFFLSSILLYFNNINMTSAIMP